MNPFKVLGFEIQDPSLDSEYTLFEAIEQAQELLGDTEKVREYLGEKPVAIIQLIYCVLYGIADYGTFRKLHNETSEGDLVDVGVGNCLFYGLHFELGRQTDIASGRVSEAARQGRAAIVGEAVVKHLFFPTMAPSLVPHVAMIVLSIIPMLQFHPYAVEAVELAVLKRVEESGRFVQFNGLELLDEDPDDYR